MIKALYCMEFIEHMWVIGFRFLKKSWIQIFEKWLYSESRKNDYIQILEESLYSNSQRKIRIKFSKDY